MERILQCLQVATWLSLKWSCGVLVIMTFFVAHAGQENWIAHPVLVPCVSGFKSYCFFIGVFVLMVFFTIGATTKNRLGNRKHLYKKGFADLGGHRTGAVVLIEADLLSKPFKIYNYMLSLRIERWEELPRFPSGKI